MGVDVDSQRLLYNAQHEGPYGVFRCADVVDDVAMRSFHCSAWLQQHLPVCVHVLSLVVCVCCVCVSIQVDEICINPEACTDSRGVVYRAMHGVRSKTNVGLFGG